MKLVDHDVVEDVPSKLVEVPSPAQGLYGREQHVGVAVFLFAGVEPQVCLGTDPAEGLVCLVEDLLAMRDEEHASVVGTTGVEGGQPRLPQARGQHDQPRGISLSPSTDQSVESFLLNGVR